MCECARVFSSVFCGVCVCVCVCVCVFIKHRFSGITFGEKNMGTFDSVQRASGESK